MSNSQTSSHNVLFGIVAAAVIIVVAAVAALSYGPLASTSRGLLYTAALNEYNNHNYAATLRLLNYYRPASTQSLNLLVRADLEQGSVAAAIGPAESAHRLEPADTDTTLLLGAAYALDHRNSSLIKLIAAQKSSQTAQALSSLKASDIVQAQELYVLGLLRSSQRVAVAVHLPSSQRSILLANLIMDLTPGRAGAIAATPYAKNAVALDPTNQTAQKLYISVSRKTGDSTTANQQAALLARLQTGRP